MDKLDSMQGQMGNVIREGSSKNESKRNARGQKHCNRNDECL